MGRTHGSVSSAGSLSYSESSSHSSQLLQTPPGSPRSPSTFAFASPADSFSSLSSNSPQTPDADDICAPPMVPLTAQAADALARLNLVSQAPTWSTSQQYDPLAHLHSAPRSTHSSATELANKLQSSTSSVSSSGSKASRKPILHMDLSQMRPFEFQVNTLGAPLIGCLPTPSPTTTTFSGCGPFTPRPSLTSRFSDESSTDSSPRTSPDSLTVPGSDKRPRAINASLAAPSIAPNGPITPRTADALNCFGIMSSSATSMLMSRSKSRDKPNSPTNVCGGRFMPRSPLGMPSTNPLSQKSYKRPAISPLSSKDAKRMYHQLIPGEKARLADLLATPSEEISSSPFDWIKQEAQNDDAISPHGDVNPYFMP